ncbi:MAG: ATP-grasp domain-containing protein [Myxococcaceae bacterium]|nr:ATP-grasp domain-containing protein [Myxococcaceae bacterium]
MLIAILHNRDADALEDDPGREAREDVVRVASALANALTHGRTLAEPLPVHDSSLEFVTWLERRRPELVINLCESLAADARGEMLVPCLLELLGQPYTGSGALALGLALHKDKAKEVLRARGVSTPGFASVQTPEQLAALELPFPLIVKPSREDASVGMDFDSVVHDRAGLERAVRAIWDRFHQPALVEQFIVGREVYVPLLGNRPREALPLTEIRFGKAFAGRPHIVSYKAKWEPSSAEYVDSPSVPVVLPEELHGRVVACASEAFAALGCQDYGRVDLRITHDGQPYVIDINPNCDLHPEAGFAKAAALAGMDYRRLAERLVEVALERHHVDPAARPVGPPRPRLVAGANRELLAARAGRRPRAHRPGARTSRGSAP